MIDNTKVSSWLIITNEHDTHYIEQRMTWKEAILNHIEWCYGSGKIKFYTKLFSKLDDFSEALELYNELFDDDRLGAVIALDDENSYIDKNYLY